MTFQEYQEQCRTTAIYPRESALTYLALGLAGEAGEVANKAKKVLRDNGGVLDAGRAHEIIMEIGDVLWYATELSGFLGYTLEEVADLNLTKLRQRQVLSQIGGQGDER